MSTKRPRTAAQENLDNCPFTVTLLPNPAHKYSYKAKTLKLDATRVKAGSDVQISPFNPIGKFTSRESMDVYYAVEPRKRWLSMTSYNSFILNGTKYFRESYVYVANEATTKRQTTAADWGSSSAMDSDVYWVARIQEIKATDEFHVYARILWMYLPDELPSITVEGNRAIVGRQSYHGKHELIASNHVDIINVISVAMPVTVNQLVEADDQEIQDALYWRQAYNCRTNQLSSLELRCKCKTPANPDEILVGCTDIGCGEWLHFSCLHHNVLMRVFKELGMVKPHKAEQPDEEDKEQHSGTLRLTAHQAEESQSTAAIGKNHIADDVLVTQDRMPKSVDTSPSGPSAGIYSTSSALKKGRGNKSRGGEPYQGLFDATLKMDEGPTVWVITDLRQNVEGADRTWTEAAKCLLCGGTIA